MQVGGVDERDSGWEDSSPRFRVYLHTSEPDQTYGSTDTYDLTDADVLQAIDWAQRQAGTTLTYAVALVRDDPDEDAGYERGLVWLVGMDGNDDTTDYPDEQAIQQRMLARRRTPVGIPEADRVPDGVPMPYVDGTKKR